VKNDFMIKKDITNILKKCFWEYNFSEDDIIAFKSKDDRLKITKEVFNASNTI